MPKYGNNIDLQKNQVQNPVAHLLASNPGTPATGQFYFNTTALKLRVYNGTTWDEMGSGNVGYADLPDIATAGIPLLSGGSGGDPSYTALNLAQATAISGKLPLANVTTGGTVGQPLLAGASDPAYGALDLSTATGTTGILKAASFPALAGDLSGTNGSLSVTVSTVGGASAANIADAVTKRHNQNTDTGTTATSFQIDSGNSGPRVKNSSGEVQLRNAGDSAYADLRVNNLYVTGSQFILDSNTVNIGDSNIELNSDIDANASNSNGGVTIRRLKTDAAGTGTVDITASSTTVTGTGTSFTTQLAVGDIIVVSAQRRRVASITSNTVLDTTTAFTSTLTGQSFTFAGQGNAVIEFDNSTTERWQTTFGAVTGPVTRQIALKYATDIGDGSSTSFVITHNLGTRDVVVMIRENASPYAMIVTDVEMTSTNTLTVSFTSAPTSNQYRVIVQG
jgi:hypothetical protein